MVLRVLSSDINYCLKSGIHEHSPNSQIDIQVFFWLSWSTEELAPCAKGFSQIFTISSNKSFFAVPGLSRSLLNPLLPELHAGVFAAGDGAHFQEEEIGERGNGGRDGAGGDAGEREEGVHDRSAEYYGGLRRIWEAQEGVIEHAVRWRFVDDRSVLGTFDCGFGY